MGDIVQGGTLFKEIRYIKKLQFDPFCCLLKNVLIRREQSQTKGATF
jgi:hypothetical protein